MKVEYAPGFEKSLRRLIWRQRLEPINPAGYYRKLKYFCQRGKRGYADCDIWSFDSYLEQVIAGGCRQLKHIHHGYPAALAGKNDKTEAQAAKRSQQWADILESIALGFEASAKLKWDEENEDIPLPGSGRYKTYTKQYEKGMGLFVKYFPNLWD